jgi:hypothetical protein
MSKAGLMAATPIHGRLLKFSMNPFTILQEISFFPAMASFFKVSKGPIHKHWQRCRQGRVRLPGQKTEDSRHKGG